MAAQIKWAYRDRGRLEEMGIRARALASELFSESKAKESWSRLLDSVTQGS